MTEVHIEAPMRVTILGSGTCVPSMTRSSCSVLVEAPQAMVLIDIGVGTMHRLLMCGKTIADLDLIFVSHFHPDHTAELVPFLFASKHGGPPHRRKPLSLMGGPGFKDFFKKLESVYGHWISLSQTPLNLIEQSAHNTQTQIGTLRLKTAPVNHNPESVALRVTDAQKKSMVYSGDTDQSDSLVALARDADLLICECAFPDQEKVPGHLSPGLAGQMATAANVNHLMLTHFYPACENVDLASQVRSTYRGPVTLATDLLKVVL